MKKFVVLLGFVLLLGCSAQPVEMEDTAVPTPSVQESQSTAAAPEEPRPQSSESQSSDPLMEHEAPLTEEEGDLPVIGDEPVVDGTWAEPEPPQDEILFVFRVKDSAGNPIPNVYIDVISEQLIRGTELPRIEGAGYTDQKGMATLDMSRFHKDDLIVEISEGYKIKKSIRYAIRYDEKPGEYVLIWDYGNPDHIQIPVISSATIIVRDKAGKPVSGCPVYASYFLRLSEDGTGYDSYAELGVLDKDGKVVWENPHDGIDMVELSLEYKGVVNIFDFQMSKSKGNTDYIFQWTEE